MRLKREAARYLSEKIHITCESKVDLIGLMDSYGVPYSPFVENSFMDYLEKDLRKQNKLGSSLNLFNLYVNKTWQLNGVFNNRITIGEFNCIQNYSLDLMRHKYPEHIKNDLKYSKDSELENRSVYDYVSSKACPVILYSCVANDIFYYFDFSPETLTLKKCIDIATHFKEETKTIGNHVNENLQTILDCNSNASVYVMGLYLPSDHFFLHLVAGNIIRKFNKEIENACQGYANVHYIDVSCLSCCVLKGDFHPNADGQYILFEKIAEAMNLHPLPNTSGGKGAVSCFQEDDSASAGDMTQPSMQLYEKVFQSDRSMRDYVECAALIEWGLSECNLQNVNYIDLSAIKKTFLEKIKQNHLKENFDLAFDIEIILKKILHNISESEYAMNP